MLRKILYTAFWMIVFTGTLLILGFVSGSEASLICEEIKIEIDYSEAMYFVKSDDVVEKLKENSVYPPGRRLSEIKLKEIEKSVREIPEVKNVEVYKTVDGQIGISITQKNPLVRVMGRNGKQFYLDREGYQMPVTGSFYPRIIVANGYINEPETEFSAKEIALNEELKTFMKSDDIYAMAEYISSNDFWNAQIQEIYFNRDGEIELIPVVGNHRILFGNAENIDEKFNKLYKFYKEGLKKSGWNKYETINLKYKKQIVCTKRNNN